MKLRDIVIIFVTACLYMLIVVIPARAANVLAGPEIIIDTPASGDVTISSARIFITNITITAYTSAKTITFIDKNDNVVLILECPAGYTISWPTVPSKEGLVFPNGLYLDDTATDLENSSDYVFIWRR